MKEQNKQQLETLSPEALLIVDELLNSPEYEGQDVSEIRKIVFEIFNEKMKGKNETR